MKFSSSCWFRIATSNWYTSFWNFFDMLRSLTCCLTPTYVANGSFGLLKIFIVSRTGGENSFGDASQRSLPCIHGCKWLGAREHMASIDVQVQQLGPYSEENN